MKKKILSEEMPPLTHKAAVPVDENEAIKVVSVPPHYGEHCWHLRISVVPPAKPLPIVHIKDAQTAFDFIYQYVIDENTDIRYDEHVWVLLLNNCNHVIGFAKVATGNATQSIFPISKFLQYALLTNASNIICVHNHPSGSVKPSNSDKRGYDDIVSSFNALAPSVNIHVLDSIIIAVDIEGVCHAYSIANDCKIV